MKKIFALITALCMALSLCACGGEDSLDPSRFSPDEDNKLVIYTSHKEEIYAPIIHEFEQQTGIWVEIVTGGTNELLDKIKSGSDAPEADIMFGGGVESLESYKDCFEPYFSPQSGYLQSTLTSEDGLWTPFSALPQVLIYNTKLVGEDELTGWGDLISGRFDGKIAYSDPARSGSAFTAMVTMLYALNLREDTIMERFARALDGGQLSSSGDVLTCVADGSMLVGITLEETALKRIAAGDSIAIVYPKEGTSCVPDGSAIIKDAPHRENAELFMEFIISGEIQSLLGEELYRRPVRTDLEDPGTLKAMEEIKLVDYDVGYAANNRGRILYAWEAALLKEAEE